MYNLLWFLMIYSCLGWCAEVVHHTVSCGDFQNRGFLNGPVCPIYGFGAVLVLLCLKPLGGSLGAVFFASMIITTVLEFLTGYILEKVFRNKWWDYSDLPFNIKGYVCLKYSLLWGFLCTFAVRVIHPVISAFVGFIPKPVGIILLSVLYALFVCDTAFTAVTLFSLKKRLRIIEEVSGEMRNLSDNMGEKISDRVLSAVEKTKEYEIDAAKKREEYEKKLRALLSEKHLSHRRLIKAFPTMSSKRFGNALEKLKKQFDKKNDKS